MKKLLSALYASEINLTLGWLWDGGVDVKIGDNLNGFIAEENFMGGTDWDTIEDWIESAVKKHYPDSDFAKTYNKEFVGFDEAVKPAIRYLLQNHHPHTKIYIDYSTAELLEGREAINLAEEVPD